MRNYLILCEGVTDQFFITHCLASFYGFSYSVQRIKTPKEEKFEILVNEKIKVIEIGGCSNIAKKIVIDMLSDNEKRGGENIIILDADEKGIGNNGFENCNKKLTSIKENESISFNHYLWPKNKSDGDIENLLEKLIPPSTQPILDCIKSHRDCLNRISTSGIRIPERKDVIRYYLYTCFQDNTPTKVNYSDTNYWDLNNNQLSELRQFLDGCFKMGVDYA